LKGSVHKTDKGTIRIHAICKCGVKTIYENTSETVTKQGWRRFKNVKKNLLAMKRLNEGKDVDVTETLGLLTDEDIEKENNLKEILPEKLKIGNHSNLRNSIAHANFRYINDENKMEFWDVYPFSQKYSMEPIRLTFKEFTNSLLEVKFFCDIFGFIVMAHIAMEDIVKRYS